MKIEAFIWYYIDQFVSGINVNANSAQMLIIEELTHFFVIPNLFMNESSYTEVYDIKRLK
jgi:hypothetical protein